MIDLKARKFVALAPQWVRIKAVAEELLERHEMTGKEIRTCIHAAIQQAIKR